MKNTFTNVLLIGIGLTLVIGFVAVVGVLKENAQTDQTVAGIRDAGCTVSHSVAAIGDDIASTILAANQKRAWATIQQPTNATNTPSLSFGGTAVLAQDFILDDVPTTTAERASITFGRNTEFPFVGAVTGITNLGSTTVNVTECTY